MRTDFLNQSAVDQGLQLPSDTLGHEATATRLLAWSAQLPAGAVIAVQGDWGRGKTDVLARVAAQTVRNPGPAGSALWLNPWQYGTPDLLTPLVQALQERAGVHDNARLRAAASRLVKAGVNFGLKAAGEAIPGGQLLEIASPAVQSLLEGESESGSQKVDPVMEMAQDFRELTLAALGDYAEVGTRLIVCVDDLDRCLPGRQVALLQGLRFLVAAGAPVTLLIALDPVLAHAGVRLHYGAQEIDADRYLDKIFDLRLSLPGLDPLAVAAFFSSRLQQPVRTERGDFPLAEQLSLPWLEVHAGAIAPVQSLRNPRVLARLCDKLRVLAATGDLPAPPTQAHAESLLLWLAFGERWPRHRALVQAAPDFAVRLSALARQVGGHPGQAYDPAPEVQALARDPQLGVVLDRLLESDLGWLAKESRALGALGI